MDRKKLKQILYDVITYDRQGECKQGKWWFESNKEGIDLTIDDAIDKIENEFFDALRDYEMEQDLNKKFKGI